MLSLLKKRQTVPLMLCLVVGFALRYYTFDRKSLWMDEVYTYEDSRDDLRGQIRFYEKNPTFLHPPLFFVLTHLFHPFEKPERDLRIIPVIFGTLSIPMLYLLAGSFSTSIALPCTIALTFMTYHISLSQDARAYTLILFLGMTALFFFLKYLKTSKKKYLLLVALLFSASFYTSYSTLLFLVFSQLLWLYRLRPNPPRSRLSSFLFLNGLILLFCLPWVIFLFAHYRGQALMEPLQTGTAGLYWANLFGILHDWAANLPLMILSVLLLILLPAVGDHRRNGLLLLACLLLPVGGLSLLGKVFDMSHFVTSRYFIDFLPLFLVSLYLSVEGVELKSGKIKKWVRPKLLFTILFVGSSLAILPFYYQSEKQDFRGLATYLKGHLREGDKVYVATSGYMPGILYYLGIPPSGRHHTLYYVGHLSERGTDFRIPFSFQGNPVSLHYSEACCTQYMMHGTRLWLVVGKVKARELSKHRPFVLKGFFDGSFLNFDRFPTDASMYLFLWDPSSPEEKGIDLRIE